MREKKYYVTGNTAEGFVNFLSSNVKKFDHVVILKHPSNTLKTQVLKEVIQNFDTGHEVEILCSALGSKYLDGVIIRDKGVAFIIDTAASQGLSGAVEIDLELFLEVPEQPDTTDTSAAVKQCIQSAYDNFKKGLAIHDNLEKIYINEMDFQKADKEAEKFIERVFRGESKRQREPQIYRRLFGTNTPDGAVNTIDNLIEPLASRYYLKGRAGTGKSHFMKKVMKAAEDRGMDIELYHCSFDPNSVDMVLVPELEFCIFDSTDPHEKMPESAGDVVIDLYEKTVTQGTDEKFSDEIDNITRHYKSYMKKGMESLFEAGQYMEVKEQQYMFTEKDVNHIAAFILEHVIQ